MPQGFKVVGSDEHVVMIRQHAPSVSAGRKFLTGAQQISFKVGHSFMAQADMVFVFEAGSGDEELSLPDEIQVRWRVPRMLMQTTVFDGCGLLPRRHLAIVVHRARQSN